MRVYISGPLQGSTDLPAARALYETIATIVSEAGMEPYVPHLHTDPEHAAHVTAAEVYRRDAQALLDADVVIAHVGAPSTGVGAELALAANAGIAIIGLARCGERVSRFAEGLIDAAGGHTYLIHGDPDMHTTLTDALESTSRVVSHLGQHVTEHRRRVAS